MPDVMRPPALPLITIDPFLSIWSFADTLAGDVTRHWTGAANSLLGLVRIDGQPWRFMGLESEDRGSKIGELPALPQTGLAVTATRTTVAFSQSGVRMSISFQAPFLLDDLMVASRPLNIITTTCAGTDGLPHQVELYLEIGGEICCDSAVSTDLHGRTETLAGLSGICLGSRNDQVRLLASSGDDHRISWGEVHLLSLSGDMTWAVSDQRLRRVFDETGRIDAALTGRYRQAENDKRLVGAGARSFALGADGSEQTCALMFAYDDRFSIDYFGCRRPSYCFKDGAAFADVVGLTAVEYPVLAERCAALDLRLANASERVGGLGYAALTALAYRQAVAAHKLIADESGAAVFLSKECFSNGCIGTVDVSYPSAPLFLLLNPELVRGMLRPVFAFAASPAWPYAFAPHDVGQYPLATGQVYGLREGQYVLAKQMPVEECGNMLILTAAACSADQDWRLAEANLRLLGRWAEYLAEYGADPAEQLCTDDFAGHLGHNVNLSIKAIVGLGAYALILASCGQTSQAELIRRRARAMAVDVLDRATDGDCTRLTYDRPGSWSMKYNLLFDRLLRLELFPDDVYRQEVAAYIKRANCYGLPLDSRATYTKADWLVWCAALSDDREQAQSLLAPLVRYYGETGSRVPLTDWYETISGRALHFRNRTVVGGFFALLLKDRWLSG